MLRMPTVFTHIYLIYALQLELRILRKSTWITHLKFEILNRIYE